MGGFLSVVDLETVRLDTSILMGQTSSFYTLGDSGYNNHGSEFALS
jgi:hypothetical protein